MNLIRRLTCNGSIRTRLLLWNVCAVTLILAVMGGIIKYTVEALLYASVDRDLERMTRPFTGRGGPNYGIRAMFANARQPGGSASTQQNNGPPPRGRNEFEATTRDRTANWGRFISLDGKVLFPFEQHIPWDISAFHQAAAGQPNFATIAAKGERWRIRSVPIRIDRQIAGVFQAPYRLTDTDRGIATMNTTMLSLIPVAVILAGLGAAAVTSRALRPVGQIAHTAGQIGAHDLSQRLAITGNDEFSRLAATFNGMLGRLESAFGEQRSLVCRLKALLEQQRRFTADASHELRTPLTVIKANTSQLIHMKPSEIEYCEAIHDIDQAAETMNRLVQDLMLLARCDAGQLGRQVAELPILEILERARRQMSNGNGARINVDVSDPELTVAADEGEIVRVFSNLLDNAARHTPADGSITMSARQTGAEVEIDVADTGSGISPEHIPHLGERFYRVDEARARCHGGSGLGLSICKEIVQSHRGSISFSSALGRGTTVRIVLPRQTTSGESTLE